MPKLIHKELGYTVRGVLMHVHNELGPMLPERFYQDAIALGLESRGIRYETEKVFEVLYRNVRVGLYLVDVWIENGKIILELKVAPEILPLHKAQALSYLKVTDADLAIVVSYGAESLHDERLPNYLRNKTVRFDWVEGSMAADMLYPELTNRIFEALHRVHLKLGPGFLHQVYRRATMVELEHQELNYEYIKQVPIYYREHNLGHQPARLIRVEEKVLLATVAVKQLSKAMEARLKARLKHLGLGGLVEVPLISSWGNSRPSPLSHRAKSDLQPRCVVRNAYESLQRAITNLTSYLDVSTKSPGRSLPQKLMG